jgi:exodeoxyribonuclease VII small subunit
MGAAKEPEQNFEGAIARLEEIVDAMESDKMPLEELIVRYEEGVKLVKVCQEKLEAAERRIEVISKGAGGKPQLTEYQAPASASASAVVPPVSKMEEHRGAEDVSLF